MIGFYWETFSYVLNRLEPIFNYIFKVFKCLVFIQFSTFLLSHGIELITKENLTLNEQGNLQAGCIFFKYIFYLGQIALQDMWSIAWGFLDLL